MPKRKGEETLTNGSAVDVTNKPAENAQIPMESSAVNGD